MKRCLLCVSLLCIALMAVAQDYVMPLDGRRQYAVTIAWRSATVTGICVVKTDGEGSRGAVVNEFGVHALDFTLSADRRHVKLLNVIPWMDRWYVKRVMRKDLRFLFGSSRPPVEGVMRKGKRMVTVADDGTVTMTNERYGLVYSFKETGHRMETDEDAEASDGNG